MKRLERIFEWLLWNSRLVIVVAVVASTIVALVMFYVATADVVYLTFDVAHYAAVDVGAREHLHASIVAHVAEIVDAYLFATIMIIFSMGLYELFIGKIDAAERSPVAPRLLLIRSLDDLKERLAKVVFLILIVRYFEYALQATIVSSADLLYLAIGIALVAVALYLTSRSAHVAPEAAPSSAGVGALHQDIAREL
ncbi:MAG: YqhA family protein [Vulcanimicrobiaceae bacterium]